MISFQPKSPVYRATIEKVTACGDDFVLKLSNIEEHAPNVQATIQLPRSSTSHLAVHRWAQAMGAVWGDIKDRKEDGATVDINQFVGKRVRVCRARVIDKLDNEYNGWDFAPQNLSDAKAKIAVGSTLGKVKRFFRGRR